MNLVDKTTSLKIKKPPAVSVLEKIHNKPAGGFSEFLTSFSTFRRVTRCTPFVNPTCHRSNAVEAVFG